MWPDCVFCSIVNGSEPAAMVAAWPDAVAFIPLDPVTPGHVLVVPTIHVPDFAADPAVTAATTTRAAELVRTLPRNDWNLITSRGHHATQSISHLHLHLVPRRPGDGLALPWTGQETP